MREHSPVDRCFEAERLRFSDAFFMPVEFRQHVLPNGLTIAAEVDPDAHTAAMGFFVRTGARDEETRLMGVSHFLEHMMFKGTAKRTADEVNQHFDDIGASHNAFTSAEITAFWAHTLPEHLDRAEEILADILRPALRQSDFDLEKNVILEEIAMYEDQPFWQVYEKAMERYYAGHPLRHRVLGTRESIHALSRDQMAAYFDARYSADNTVVALAGRVDFDAHVRSLEARCSSWGRKDPQREYPAHRPADDAFTEQSEKVNRQYLFTVAPAPSAQDDDRYAAAILSNILGDSEGSRLYWSLIETGLAEDAQAQYDPRDRTGEYYVFAVCAPEDARRVEDTILDEVAKLADSITDDDLLRVRSKIATGVTVAGERPSGRMRRLGQLLTLTGEYRTLEEELRRIDSVSLADLRRVLAKWPMRPKVTGRLRPAGCR
jgi:predicted Zn-dependent peptidase